MTLNEFVAQKKRALWNDLLEGRDPSEGEFESSVLSEARALGVQPQIGKASFTPHTMTLEFIYSGTGGSTMIVPVTLDAPDRIVFLPVPDWVVQTIWQGEVDGSFQFAAQAMQYVDQFINELSEEENTKWFGPRQASRRE
ncbi:MAG: hypothetical protein JNM85_00435 [Chthonomonas sp.]|nr:hypothetical protein [Chthonomonas sp.]